MPSLDAGVGRRRGRSAAGQLEALEEEPPALVHRSGILLPARVGVLDGVQVPAAGEGARHIGNRFSGRASFSRVGRFPVIMIGSCRVALHKRLLMVDGDTKRSFLSVFPLHA